MPPLQSCMECGDQFRTFSRNPLCGRCVRDLNAAPPAESLRDFRLRVPSLQDVLDRAKRVNL